MKEFGGVTIAATQGQRRTGIEQLGDAHARGLGAAEGWRRSRSSGISSTKDAVDEEAPFKSVRLGDEVLAHQPYWADVTKRADEPEPEPERAGAARSRALGEQQAGRCQSPEDNAGPGQHGHDICARRLTAINGVSKLPDLGTTSCTSKSCLLTMPARHMLHPTARGATDAAAARRHRGGAKPSLIPPSQPYPTDLDIRLLQAG